MQNGKERDDQTCRNNFIIWKKLLYYLSYLYNSLYLVPLLQVTSGGFPPKAPWMEVAAADLGCTGFGNCGVCMPCQDVSKIHDGVTECLAKAAKGSWILVSCLKDGDILVTSNIRCDSGDWDSATANGSILSPKGVLASAPWKQCHAYLMMEESQCLQSCPFDGLKFHNHIKYGLQKLIENIEIHQTTTNKLLTCTCTDIYRPILFPFRRNRTYLWFNSSTRGVLCPEDWPLKLNSCGSSKRANSRC